MIDVTWPQLKEFVDSRALSVQWIDNGDQYLLAAVDGIFTLTHAMDKDPSDTACIDEFEGTYKIEGNHSVGHQSIKIMLAKASGVTNLATGIANAAMKIPGTFGVDAAGNLLVGRTISGGRSDFAAKQYGDYVVAEVRDDDNLLGYGAGTVLDTFHDTGTDSAHSGWYFLGRPIDLSSVVTDDPTNLPAGMYLYIIGYKAGTLPLAVADTLYANIHWGQRIR
jgi:hypothetical protein